MTATDLLQDIRRLGLTIKAEGDALRVAPAGRLPPELRDAAKIHRRELLALLRPLRVSVPASPPVPRAGARLFFSDDWGRPCKAEGAYMWCWDGAGRWLYARDFPVPAHTLALRPDYPARCPSCARREFRVAWQEFSNGTMHLRCECGVCGRFIKHLKPPPNNLALEYRAAARGLETRAKDVPPA
jgi:hypothetical protein